MASVKDILYLSAEHFGWQNSVNSSTEKDRAKKAPVAHSFTDNKHCKQPWLLSWLDKLCILNLPTDIWGTKKHIIAKKQIPLKQNHDFPKLNVNDIRWHRKSISLYTCTLGIKKKSTVFLNLKNAHCKNKIM